MRELPEDSKPAKLRGPRTFVSPVDSTAQVRDGVIRNNTCGQVSRSDRAGDVEVGEEAFWSTALSGDRLGTVPARAASRNPRAVATATQAGRMEARLYIKVCGLRTAAAAEVAIEAGADAIGVVHAPGSPRHLEPDAARAIVESAQGAVDTVLVVATMPVADAVELARDLEVDVLQLHGRYTTEDFAIATSRFPRVWRATSLDKSPDLHVGALGEELILLDAPRAGGGVAWDLSSLTTSRPDGKWLLAGGLRPSNVARAIASAGPWGVDVSSGVESMPGEKDPELIRLFLSRARAA